MITPTISDATVALPRQQFDALQSTLRTQGAEIAQLKQQLDWFKRQGKGHLTRMNAVLRAYYEANRKKAS